MGFVQDFGVIWMLQEGALPFTNERMRQIADDPPTKEDVRQALGRFRNDFLEPALENWTSPPEALRHIANHPELPGYISRDWLVKKFGPMAERWTLADAETQPDPHEFDGYYLMSGEADDDDE